MGHKRCQIKLRQGNERQSNIERIPVIMCSGASGSQNRWGREFLKLCVFLDSLHPTKMSGWSVGNANIER